MFRSSEREFDRLDEWVRSGDWVLDIGANVGHYSLRLSNIVGPAGRVIIFEPVPQTFELLSANMARSPYHNITLLNVAVSEAAGLVGMDIPKWAGTGLDNCYEARMTQGGAELYVLRVTVDSLNIPNRVKLAKIDVEGNEISALKGMKNLIRRDYPVLIVEGRSDEVASYLKSFGYSFEENEGSPNRIFRHINS
ncbi:MAG: FkbM family methyltransferase [Candidatus Omnitrophica bacterium]|nr:FkbM family methyltransferase [Candidatus Omnitrophota bacterium]